MTDKIYVGNLPFKVDDNELKEIFSEFGEISEAVVITEKYSGRSKGFGFVTFADAASVEKAISGMEGKEVGGRALKVNEARPREDEAGSGPADEPASDEPAEDMQEAA